MASSTASNLWVLLGLGLAGVYLMTRKLKKAVKEDFGAFVERLQLLPPPQPPPPKAPHPLSGLSFAISDIFDIEGFVTGFGNLDWARTHDAAKRTSSVVASLVQGGAICIGKTVLDEMAYGMFGENKQHGTPTNPAAQEHVPGGPASGSAVAVAATLVDFALGVDTIGGIRLPAAFCGVFGFRPSQGAVSQNGVIPISASLDSVGCFARDLNVLCRVGKVLLQPPLGVQRDPRQIIIADDCFQLLKNSGDRVNKVLIKSTEKIFGKHVLKHECLEHYFLSKVPSLKGLRGKDEDRSSLEIVANAAEVLCRYEFRKNHSEWIEDANPILNPLILSHVPEEGHLSDKDVEICKLVKNEVRDAVNFLLKDDGMLVIPTMADPPPKLGGKEISSREYQTRACQLLSVASMSGCCQVAMPLGSLNKCPASVSFLARNGGDQFLLDAVKKMYPYLVEQTEIASKSYLLNDDVKLEKSAEGAKEEGNLAFRNKQWQRAIDSYTRAIKYSSSNPTYYCNRAAAYLELGSFLQAEADCSTAINLDKKNVKAHFRRGTAREMLGYYKEAVEDFRYALVLEPTNKRAAQAVDKLSRLF